METGYGLALEELRLGNLISLSPQNDRDKLLTEYIPKAIFYSLDDNPHDKSIGELMLGRKIDDKDGQLPDLIQFMRLYKVKEKLDEFNGKGKIAFEDIIQLREALIHDLYSNGKHTPSPRRYRLSNGPRIVVSPKEVAKKLNLALESINAKPRNLTEGFLNNVEFYAKYIDLHPFEDANGRSARLLYNWNAIRNSIKPIHVSIGTKEAHSSFMHPFYLSGYLGSSIALLLTQSFNKKQSKEALERIKKLRTSSPYTLDLKYNLLLLLNKEDYVQKTRGVYVPGPKNQELRTAVKYMYLKGKQINDKNLITSALWLSSCGKIDDETMLNDALRSQHSGIRSMAIFTMSEISKESEIAFAKYRDLVLKTALDQNEHPAVRSQAVVQLGYQHKLDPETAMKIFKSTEDETVLVSLGKYYTCKYDQTTKYNYAESLTLPKALIASNNPELKLRGYQSLVVYADDKEVAEVIRRDVSNLNPIIKKEIIVELRREQRLDSLPIAKALSLLAEKDSDILKPLLGELALANPSANGYVDLLDKILVSKDYSDGERAHAIHALQRMEGGAEHVKTMHYDTGNITIDGERANRLERIAMTMVAAELLDTEILQKLRYKERVIFHLLADLYRPDAEDTKVKSLTGSLFALNRIYDGLRRDSPYHEIVRKLEQPRKIKT